jgi:hypothetical protein
MRSVEEDVDADEKCSGDCLYFDTQKYNLL